MRKKSSAPTSSYRSAKTGRFVTQKYAKRHPATTVRERNTLPKKS